MSCRSCGNWWHPGKVFVVLFQDGLTWLFCDQGSMAVFTVKDEEVTLESLVEEPGQTSINHLDVQVVIKNIFGRVA